MKPRQLTINRTSHLEFVEVLRGREAFVTSGSLSGNDERPYSRGILPLDFRNLFNARLEFIDYVVYSYDTPIAWHDIELGWVVPNVKYSTTTSKSQTKIKAAINAI